jgi:hypothetical protein
VLHTDSWKRGKSFEMLLIYTASYKKKNLRIKAQCMAALLLLQIYILNRCFNNLEHSARRG